MWFLPLLCTISNKELERDETRVNRKKSLQSKPNGSAIVLVMLAVAILLATGVGLVSLGMHSRVFAAQKASEITARCAVDAGLAKAVFEMNERLKLKPWDDSALPQATNQTLPNCDATFSYTVTGSLGGGYSVESTGKCGRAEKRSNAGLKLQGTFEQAIFTQGNLTLKAGTLVDGYNSNDPSIHEVELLIGTNSILPDSIVLNSGVVVDGDVVVGAGGDVEEVVACSGTIAGDKYAAPLATDLLLVTPPGLADKGKINVHGKTVTLGPNDSGRYDEIVLKRAVNPGILEIAGGDVVLHIINNIDMGEDCEIIVRPDASLTSYLGGNLSANNNAGINNQNTPAHFKLYGTGAGQTLDIKAKGNVSGAVYAPNADITIMANGDVYGAFVGKSFQMNSGGNFYYDEALKEVGINDDAVRFVETQWSEE